MTRSLSFLLWFLRAREVQPSLSPVGAFSAVSVLVLTPAAVMPYFPYSRQSKKKSHRGAITARMIANLLNVAGVDHVITLDLHATQMQGFFKCPVDNLVAEPLIARWIKRNVPDWSEAVVVSKNPGGTKRVTSLADALKLSFGIVTTDRRRPQHRDASVNGSVLFERFGLDPASEQDYPLEDSQSEEHVATHNQETKNGDHEHKRSRARIRATSGPHARRFHGGTSEATSSPLAKSAPVDGSSEPSSSPNRLMQISTAPMTIESADESNAEDFIDEVLLLLKSAR